MPDLTTRDIVAAKLHPRQVRVSPFFTAILGKLLDERWTTPAMQTSCITSDGFILADEGGFAGAPVASVDDVERNIRGVAEVAGLTPDETRWLLGRIHTAFGQDWRRPH